MKTAVCISSEVFPLTWAQNVQACWLTAVVFAMCYCVRAFTLASITDWLIDNHYHLITQFDHIRLMRNAHYNEGPSSPILLIWTAPVLAALEIITGLKDCEAPVLITTSPNPELNTTTRTLLMARMHFQRYKRSHGLHTRVEDEGRFNNIVFLYFVFCIFFCHRHTHWGESLVSIGWAAD